MAGRGVVSKNCESQLTHSPTNPQAVPTTMLAGKMFKKETRSGGYSSGHSKPINSGPASGSSSGVCVCVCARARARGRGRAWDGRNVWGYFTEHPRRYEHELPQCNRMPTPHAADSSPGAQSLGCTATLCAQGLYNVLCANPCLSSPPFLQPAPAPGAQTACWQHCKPPSR